jgi:hypothetical protein
MGGQAKRTPYPPLGALASLANLFPQRLRRGPLVADGLEEAAAGVAVHIN